MSNTSTRLEIRLKEREDEYTTYKQFYVLVGTFNVNNRQAPPNILLQQWLQQVTNPEGTKEEYIPDIIAVGFQEIDTSGGAYIYDDKKKEDDWEQTVKKTITACYERTHEKEKIQFDLVNRVRLMGILLFVYVRSIHTSHCTLVSRSSVPTGFMGIAGNKGGVGIRFHFYETDICFVNCHFASGDGQTQRRNDDYLTIESRMAFTDGPTYSIKDYIWYTPTTPNSTLPNPQNASGSHQWWKISDHDIVFWCGDMNYRISEPNERVRKALKEMSTVPLHEKDQLRCEMKLDRIFNGYQEPAIDFMPTYKFDINTDDYDTSEKMRTPSWTDRILYRAKRAKVVNNQNEIETIQVLHYKCAKDIKFSDHRPVSGLYEVVFRYECDEKRSSRIREELIREFDRLENDAIPTIEVNPRPPEIQFIHIRYLDKPNYPLTIKNIGECLCVCTIASSSMASSFESLSFTPNPPYTIHPKQEQRLTITYNAKGNMKTISEILILHVEKGADTFITLDVAFDKGPFCLALEDHPPTYYDNEAKTYIFSPEKKSLQSEHIVEMANDPPVLYIALIDCLKDRNDLDFRKIFNNEVQDALDLIPLRDQIYDNNYDFSKYSTVELFMILLHLFQSLPQPLISFEIQDKIFANTREFSSREEDTTKVVSIIIEQLKTKERNLFFRFLLLLQKAWPTKEQIEKKANNLSDILSICVDVVAASILHNHLDRNQQHTIIMSCLNEEKMR